MPRDLPILTLEFHKPALGLDGAWLASNLLDVLGKLTHKDGDKLWVCSWDEEENTCFGVWDHEVDGSVPLGRWFSLDV